MARLFPTNAFVAPKYPKNGKDLVRLVIAEAPGEQEALDGEPLVGGSGRIFNKLLERVGIDRDGLTISNCIQCRPPGNVFPTDPEARSYITRADADKSIAQCQRSHVAPLVESRRWNRIDLLGNKPLRIIAGRNEGIGNLRGSPLSIGKHRGLATYHPSYLMRDQAMIPVAANDLTKSLVEPPEHYKPFPSIEDVREFKATTFAFDIECPKYKFLGKDAPVEMVGLCAEATKALCVPVRGEYISELKRIFSGAKVLIGHNVIQFDIPKLFPVLGLEITKWNGTVMDTMLLQHLVFPEFPHDLEFVGSQFVSKPAWKGNKDVLETYCCRDTDVTFACWQELLPMVRRERLLDLYQNVQVPMARICHLMHTTGFKVNPNRIRDVRTKLEAQLIEEEKFLPDFLRSHEVLCNRRHPAPPGTLGKSGKPVKFISRPEPKRVVPWRSPDAKARYLYSSEPGCLSQDRVLDLHTGNLTTGKMALAKIYSKTKNRAVEALRILNKLDETLSTFAKEDMVKISRMYPHFNVHGTASGRLSSSDPNLQNIPEAARCIYVPSHVGWKIVDVDYSNIENRLTAILAGDTDRLKKYAIPGYSDYKLLVSRAFGIPECDVVKDNSRDAPYGRCKAIVLGINYGLGAKKISKMYDMDIKEVNRLMLTWKSEIKETTSWQIRTANEAIEKGVLTTPFGRKRWFWTSSAYTESLSFLPQSTAADIIFRAMIGLMYEKIGWPEAKVSRVVSIYKPIPKLVRLLLQVHDSLVFECPADLVDELVSTLKLVMEQPWPEIEGSVIPISVKVSDSWGEV